jgi:putative NIF3 family GTP cyclohydrolase 1 type 2
MTRVSDVVLNIEKATGRALDGDEGVQHGAGTRELNGATVAWMATPDAIQAAGEAGQELLIVHESICYPYDVIFSKSPRTGGRSGWSTVSGVRFAAECGIPMIETSHEVSENPGLRRLTGVLDEAFPDVQFAFYENECIWRMA